MSLEEFQTTLQGGDISATISAAKKYRAENPTDFFLSLDRFVQRKNAVNVACDIFQISAEEYRQAIVAKDISKFDYAKIAEFVVATTSAHKIEQWSIEDITIINLRNLHNEFTRAAPNQSTTTGSANPFANEFYLHGAGI